LDKLVDQGAPASLLASIGLDAKGIAASIRARFGGGRAAAGGEQHLRLCLPMKTAPSR
jgi:1-deoxy-D-xylulose-5-phosphate synthase